MSSGAAFYKSIVRKESALADMQTKESASISQYRIIFLYSFTVPLCRFNHVDEFK